MGTLALAWSINSTAIPMGTVFEGAHSPKDAKIDNPNIIDNRKTFFIDFPLSLFIFNERKNSIVHTL
jgi:hypothetical protein